EDGGGGSSYWRGLGQSLQHRADDRAWRAISIARDGVADGIERDTILRSDAEYDGGITPDRFEVAAAFANHDKNVRQPAGAGASDGEVKTLAIVVNVERFRGAAIGQPSPGRSTTHSLSSFEVSTATSHSSPSSSIIVNQVTRCPAHIRLMVSSRVRTR